MTNLGTLRGSYRESKQLSRGRRAIQFELRKRSCVAFNGLTDPAITAIELHRTLDLERSGVCSVSRDTNENEPLLICRNTVIYDLSASESCVAVEYLRRR